MTAAQTKLINSIKNHLNNGDIENVVFLAKDLVNVDEWFEYEDSIVTIALYGRTMDKIYKEITERQHELTEKHAMQQLVDKMNGFFTILKSKGFKITKRMVAYIEENELAHKKSPYAPVYNDFISLFSDQYYKMCNYMFDNNLFNSYY